MTAPGATARRVGARPTHQGGYARPAPSTTLVARDLRARLLSGSPTGAPVEVATSYEVCRGLLAAHGRTYYFATRFLPASERRHVYALYAFARYADDLVDHLSLGWDPARRRQALEAWSRSLLDGLMTRSSADPVLSAVVRTVHDLGISHDDLRAFLRSMAMDLEVDRYETYEDLHEYVYGSAAVIGSMMLPVLGASHPQARERAMDLGIAFQLTNFLRDVAEDWDRGRIYLPLEDLERFGVTEADFESRRVGAGMRRLLAFEAARARELYARAEAGWMMLTPRSRVAIRIAHRLYAEILDRLEAQDWQVFEHRAHVPWRRKAAVALREHAVPSHPRTSPGRADIDAHL